MFTNRDDGDDPHRNQSHLRRSLGLCWGRRTHTRRHNKAARSKVGHNKPAEVRNNHSSCSGGGDDGRSSDSDDAH